MSTYSKSEPNVPGSTADPSCKEVNDMLLAMITHAGSKLGAPNLKVWNTNRYRPQNLHIFASSNTDDTLSDAFDSKVKNTFVSSHNEVLKCHATDLFARFTTSEVSKLWFEDREDPDGLLAPASGNPADARQITAVSGPITVEATCTTDAPQDINLYVTIGESDPGGVANETTCKEMRSKPNLCTIL
jgi:hypothetical protein